MTNQPIPPKPADRFRRKFRTLDSAEDRAVEQIKSTAADLEQVIGDYVPNGREKSLAFTHLEDCVMRAVRGITE